MSSNIKVFKLTYSGNFIELSSENELDYFNLFDIIAVFVSNQKRMYVWIAKKSVQSLKNHIPQIRQIFSREHPELVLLRNITIEAGFEPPEFFDLMGFTREELRSHLQNIETRLLPIMSEINRLKNDADKLFISEEFEKAIFQANKIIELAKKIEDESVENDQKNFINQAQIKLNFKKKLKEIEEECKVVIKEFEERINVEDFRGAHGIVNVFKLKFEKEYNLMTIPLAKHILLMDQNLVETINIETNRIKNELEQLYKRYERLMTNEHLILASTILKQINNLVESISETETEDYWQSIEKEYQKKKKTLKSSILKMSQAANAKLFEHNISESIEIYKTIINKLKNICNDTLVN